MTPIRSLDHVAIVVRDTAAALTEYRDRLGLQVVSQEELETPRVRLTYLECGNAYLQLVEPLDTESAAARDLAAHGEGLHHLCFGVDDVPAAAHALGDGGPVTLGSGRGLQSAFVPGPTVVGVRLEVTKHSRGA